MSDRPLNPPASISELPLEVDDLQRRLRQTEQALEQAHARLDEFLARLAHDLRNPLAPMQHAVELLRMPAVSPAQRQRAIDVIETQIADMRRLLDDLLDVSRITRGKIELQMQAALLTDIIEGAIASNRPLVERKQQQLTVVLPDEPVWLNGEPARLTQVVAHVLHNAAQFTEPGGQIRLSAVAAEGVVICIEDTGIGISAELLPRVFDLFVRADATANGLGIGLTIAYKLVELHGGSIHASSTGPGRGSEFTIRLPRLPASQCSQAGAALKSSTSVQQPGRRILIVSNDSAFAEEWSLLLRVAGNEVRSVPINALACQAALDFQPEVMSVDVSDSVADEVCELVQRLRQEPTLYKIPMIAICGSASKPTRQRTQEAGCNAMLTKPVMIRDFLKLI